MKILILGLAAATALAVALPAAAQPRPADRGPGFEQRADDHGPRSQFSDDFDRTREDIHRGERRGDFSHSDADRLENDLHNLERDTRDFMRGDNHLSKTQVKKVQKGLDDINNRIRDARRKNERH